MVFAQVHFDIVCWRCLCVLKSLQLNNCIKHSVFSKHLIQLTPYNCEIKSAANQNMLCKSDIAVFAFGKAEVLLH